MFEFAISQQRRRAPSRRHLIALLASIVSHYLALMILIQFPHLLGTGLSNWLRTPVFSATPSDETTWRTMAFVEDPSRMSMPSAETLKALAYDWNAPPPGSRNPPIRIRWSDDTPAIELPVPAPVLEVPKPTVDLAGLGATPVAPTSGGLPDTPSASGRAPIVYLPPPEKAEPTKTPERAAQTPRKIPDEIRPPEKPAQIALTKQTEVPSVASSSTQIFEDQEKALRTEGSGLFDTKGFPLGDYASAIIERVKGHWLIPSNLRNSKGRTTVIFYIAKNGSYTDARIVASSGSNSLDLAALNAIIGSNPFPPLPVGFPGTQVGAKFVFSYNERQ